MSEDGQELFALLKTNKEERNVKLSAKHYYRYFLIPKTKY